jgi:hypothetical protein
LVFCYIASAKVGQHGGSHRSGRSVCLRKVTISVDQSLPQRLCVHSRRLTRATSTLIRNVNPRLRWHRSATAAQLPGGQCDRPDRPRTPAFDPKRARERRLGLRVRRNVNVAKASIYERRDSSLDASTNIPQSSNQYLIIADQITRKIPFKNPSGD